MAKHLTILSVLAALGVLILVVIAARLVLPACSLNPLPWGLANVCPVLRLSDTDAGQRDLAILQEDRVSLERLIAALTRDLSQLQCAPSSPATEPAELIDPDQFATRDLGVLDGCWALDSEYGTVDVETGEATRYSEWTICFPPGSEGQGQLRMFSSNGAECIGAADGAFSSDGTLVIEEAQDLVCSDGYTIFRRQMICGLTPEGTLDCVSEQPERDSGSGPVAMRPTEPQ